MQWLFSVTGRNFQAGMQLIKELGHNIASVVAEHRNDNVAAFQDAYGAMERLGGKVGDML